MELEALRYADAREAGVRPARSRARAHVCVRADGLRLRPYRQRAAGHRVRRAVPAAAPLYGEDARHLRAQHHRRGRQDQRARRPSAAIADPRTDRGDRTRNFQEDVAALGCLPPTVEPRATEHIEEMKTLIERLVASGNAYVAEDHVLFTRALDAGLRQARRSARSTRWSRARASMSRPTSAATWISCCGSPRRRASRAGRHPPASRRRAGPAGTSNARR